MGKNLRGKTASIIAILVVFVYGIFYGFNAPKLGSWKSLITNNIHLGLDLKGGAHLVLAVHVEQAVASATDRDVARLQTGVPGCGHNGGDYREVGSGASEHDCDLGDSAGEAERCAKYPGWQRLLDLSGGYDA